MTGSAIYYTSSAHNFNAVDVYIVPRGPWALPVFRWELPRRTGSQMKMAISNYVAERKKHALGRHIHMEYENCGG